MVGRHDVGQVCFPFKGWAFQLFGESNCCPSESEKLYMLSVALGAISSPEDTEVLSLLAIAQGLEVRWPDSKEQRFDSQKFEVPNL